MMGRNAARALRLPSIDSGGYHWGASPRAASDVLGTLRWRRKNGQEDLS
jgi:hypothetical protein